ncbi:MAG: hypothetical protein LBF13_02470 [Campylobacteraceae bacterium]|jgi:hypothetical protein|nr:hypothetical protein [Campylobacteraceae bacterium]
MNDMFDNLKELKQKLKSEENKQKYTSNINKKYKQNLNTNKNDKESRLVAEFKEFMKEVDI